MTLIQLILFIIAIAVGAWAVNRYIPMQEPFKMVVNILFVLLVIILLLYAAGVMGSLRIT